MEALGTLLLNLKKYWKSPGHGTGTGGLLLQFLKNNKIHCPGTGHYYLKNIKIHCPGHGPGRGPG